MVRTMLSAALAATLLAAPVQAQDVGEIVGGIARQYLQQEQDRAAFSQAQSANTLSAYQSYLRQFPNGMYAEHARERVQRLGGAVAPPSNQAGSGVTTGTQAGSGTTTGTQAEAAGAALTADQRVAVQRRLNALGYNTNGLDGNFGPGTRRAISLWQRDRDYTQTGTLTQAQASEILRGQAPAASEGTGGSAAASGPAQDEAGLALSRQQRAEVQAGLTRRGFDTRGVDGVFGRGTRSAIAAWQRANDLTATGYLTAAQVERLTAR
ncbi:peptidoglycan-binding protein [Paracoccus sp. (in: a-proteobacteria)]|uniref:peptidoglycan-binding protein n=1 Tax=Paracoccus sp. TaxID=267 RepID=UPI0026E0662C|nr:peptidoglycan-binding protein [Paracoccus sp. (in: a-proteobacteria)]MDO5369534.1 peptidoglycan-binding protein [Paracoccus sp. (in: a-proteobacteria)]